MYVGHLLTVRRPVIERLGGFEPAYDGIQDYEFLLRLVESGARIGHLPAIHYFWRATAGSVAADPGAKPGLDELQARAVQAHLDRIGCAVEARPRGEHRVRLARRGPGERSFSIVIPSRDEGELIERCLDSIHEHRAGAEFEVVVVDGGTVDERALRAYERNRVLVVDGSKGEFNYSRANNLGVEAATGDLLCCSTTTPRCSVRTGSATSTLTCACPASARSGRCSSTPTGRSSTPASRSACAAPPTT